MGTILLIAGAALLALLGVEYGLYRQAKKRHHDGVFDHGPPFIAGVDVDHGDARADHLGAIDHIDPPDHPGF